ncbi:MAG TPA: PLP-dependent aminotransferase family protein [Lachnospiraceae bacterium]|uniref:MocR-like pyridoxine biosynthesis transcription factor PdxR n=1 Tax=Acetatifactor sp. TaxID=1872090 RepID=UPI000EEF6F24|nr:PLP-dependent aminotransferase family protein [Lachnospiraceae bacterium]
MYDMTIRLRTDSDKCLYQQIYEHIRQEIREGKLLAGERLPSTRSLAEYLQVARSTVDYAYDQLLSEGYIEAKPYKGYFVCRLEGIFTMEQQEMTEPEVVRPDSQEDGTQVQVDFSPYGIDMTGFPFGVWKRITKNILNDSNSELFAQGEPQGDYDLRMTISRYLHSSRGVNCRPEQIIVGAGNDYLLLLLEKILGRHVGIAMENPTYKRAYRIFQSFAYRIYTVDMDDKGMRADRLSGLPVRAAYVMPSHQYPTGAVMTIGRRAELLRWAEKEPDRYLIEDDYDSEFRYRGKPIPSLQSSDKRGKVIYIGTFSKAIAPAIRVSYMVLPESLLEVYRRDCSFYSCTVSRIDQRILNEFIRDGYFERHLNKMRMHYRAKHDLLLAELEPFKKAFTISGEDAGLHLLLTARGAVTEAQLLSAATEAGVKVYGMSENMVETDAPKATILLGFGSVSEPEMKEGLHRLQKAWL